MAGVDDPGINLIRDFVVFNLPVEAVELYHALETVDRGRVMEFDVAGQGAVVIMIICELVPPSKYRMSQRSIGLHNKFNSLKRPSNYHPLPP